MIQRIQSIYLLLAGIFPAITFFVPWATLKVAANAQVCATITSLAYNSTIPELMGTHPYGILCLVLLSIALAFVSIFLYKNRKKQIMFVNITIALNIFSMLTAAVYVWHISSLTATATGFGLGAVFTLLAIISAVMARRGIARDEALVRSEYRIR